jgi:hypothetical protein
MSMAATRSACALRLCLLDGVGKLVQVRAECVQEPLNGEPLDASPSSLDAGDVSRVHVKPGGKLLLGEPGVVPQDPQGATECGQFGVSLGLGHRDLGLGIPGQVVVASCNRKIVGARGGCTPGRRGTGSVNYRRTDTLSTQGGCLLRQKAVFRSLRPKEESVKSNPKIDRLASVVMYILVSDGKDGMSSEAVARECERDAEKEADRKEVDLALRALIDYELAVCGEDGLYRPTRAAIEAERLSI